VVADHIARRVAGFGLEVESVGVKHIILLGEMKVILAKVVEAEKITLANVIRRREVPLDLAPVGFPRFAPSNLCVAHRDGCRLLSSQTRPNYSIGRS